MDYCCEAYNVQTNSVREIIVKLSLINKPVRCAVLVLDCVIVSSVHARI